jgi:hypothetical protein
MAPPVGDSAIAATGTASDTNSARAISLRIILTSQEILKLGAKARRMITSLFIDDVTAVST